MKATKLVFESNLAHFKSTMNARLQTTYIHPPISAVIGIIKKFTDVENLIFGYNFSYENLERQINIQNKITLIGETERYKDKKNTTNNIVELLTNPKLEIVFLKPINEINFTNETIVLGRNDCLCSIDFDEIEIENKKTIQENVLTNMTDGFGKIMPPTMPIETVWDPDILDYKRYYKYLRLNSEYECQYGYFDEKLEEWKGLYLWKYIKEGEIKCFKELI